MDVSDLPAALNHSLVRQYFDLVNQFKYVRYETPLSDPVYPISVSIGYLVLVFFLNWIMKKSSRALPIDGLVAFHNFVLFVASLFMFVGMGFHLLFIYLKHQSFYVMICDNDLLFTGRGGLSFWIYFFYLSKYYELLDTIFLCLRKKPLSFLHVYHHAITLLLIFSCLHDNIPVQWVAEWLNAGVHTPMYYYYLVSSFGIQPWWKRYLTQMQIIQFLIVLSVQSAVDYIFFWKKEPCYAADAFGAYFGKFVVASYLVLFIVFYIRTYNKPRTPRAPRTTKRD